MWCNTVWFNLLDLAGETISGNKSGEKACTSHSDGTDDNGRSGRDGHTGRNDGDIDAGHTGKLGTTNQSNKPRKAKGSGKGVTKAIN